MGTRIGAWLLWGVAVGFEGMARFTHERLLAKVALWPLGFGIFFGIAALAGGLHRWLRLPARDRGLRRGMWLLVAELCVLGLFGSSLALSATGAGLPLAFELSALGFLGALAVGWARDGRPKSQLG